MFSRLTGTVALVTGASSGIGNATARTLARLGAAVVLVARRRDRLDALVGEIERDGGKAFAIALDITDRASAEAAVHPTRPRPRHCVSHKSSLRSRLRDRRLGKNSAH